MDSAQWPQVICTTKTSVKKETQTVTRHSLHSKESGMVNSIGEIKVMRPNKDQIFKCPRCHSTNTKFCYYNNYSLNQPRYLCKICKRYWTQGGSLRNVPIGGGSRKTKKSNSPQFLPQNPRTQQVQGHNYVVSQFLEMPKIENNISINNQHESSCSASSAQISAPGMMMLGNRDMNPCIQTGAFCFQELKPTLGFGSDQEYGGRVTLSFGHLYKQISRAREGDQNKGQGNSGGCWNGM